MKMIAGIQAHMRAPQRSGLPWKLREGGPQVLAVRALKERKSRQKMDIIKIFLYLTQTNLHNHVKAVLILLCGHKPLLPESRPHGNGSRSEGNESCPGLV